jgi:hypothetical protein
MHNTLEQEEEQEEEEQEEQEQEEEASTPSFILKRGRTSEIQFSKRPILLCQYGFLPSKPNVVRLKLAMDRQ